MSDSLNFVPTKNSLARRRVLRAQSAAALEIAHRVRADVQKSRDVTRREELIALLVHGGRIGRRPRMSKSCASTLGTCGGT